MEKKTTMSVSTFKVTTVDSEKNVIKSWNLLGRSNDVVTTNSFFEIEILANYAEEFELSGKKFIRFVLNDECVYLVSTNHLHSIEKKNTLKKYFQDKPFEEVLYGILKNGEIVETWTGSLSKRRNANIFSKNNGESFIPIG